MSAILPRRDDPESWYPAGVPHVSARWLILTHGERVRVVEATPERPVSPDSTVLLLHGWGCNAFHFRRLLPALAQRGLRAIAVDLCGHGLSHKPADAAAYSSPALAGFTQHVLEALGLPRAGLLGHSLGGATALDAAAVAPERVPWLVLLNPVGLSRLPYTKLFSRISGRFAERIPAPAARVFAKAALHLAYGRITRPDRGDLEQYLFPALAPGGRHGLLAFASAFSWAPRPAATLSRITCPACVMFGERDHVVRLHEAVERVRAIPQARIEIVAQAGHVLAEEVPERVADVVAGLARNAAAPNDASRAQGATR